MNVVNTTGANAIGLLRDIDLEGVHTIILIMQTVHASHFRNM